MTIAEMIELMKRKGSHLANPVPVKGMSDMEFDCSFACDGVNELVGTDSVPLFPCDLVDFWRISRAAKLFEDKTYGQWGLEILDPESALIATANLQIKRFKDYLLGDLVLGRFIGDSDLLVIRCDPSSSDFGHLLVAAPMDPRKEWYRVAESLSAFLDLYIKAGGDKAWVSS